MNKNQKITKMTKSTQTQFLGAVECEYSLERFDETKTLTVKQLEWMKEFIGNHVKSQNHVVTTLHVFICKFFVSAYITYFPKDSRNRIYTERVKELTIGPKGAVKKFTAYSGMEKISERKNMADIARYYLRPEE
jgi:hypothetical protein